MSRENRFPQFVYQLRLNMLQFILPENHVKM